MTHCHKRTELPYKGVNKTLCHLYTVYRESRIFQKYFHAKALRLKYSGADYVG